MISSGLRRKYAQWGYTQAPEEGPFGFRLRAEYGVGLRSIDETNPTREKLYAMWCARQGIPRPLVHNDVTDRTISNLLDTVSRMWGAPHP